MQSSVNLQSYLICPTQLPHLYLSLNKSRSHCNLHRPHHHRDPSLRVSSGFWWSRSSAIQRLALSIPFFLPSFLTHAIRWDPSCERQRAAAELTGKERERKRNSFLLPRRKKTEPVKDSLKGNQSGFCANSWLQRKHRPTSGKKETHERKSATTGGDFSSPTFPGFLSKSSHFFFAVAYKSC